MTMTDSVLTPRRRAWKRLRIALQNLPYVRAALVLASLPRLAIWRRTKAVGMAIVPGRRSLHSIIGQTTQGRRILYLEFGVFRGDSIKYWLTLNDNPGSRFYGFDTFTGLPEKWETNLRGVAGNDFDTRGDIPAVDDPRCAFLKGLFQDSLPGFLTTIDAKQFDQIILHMDADLYSSTLFVLAECNGLIRPGAILIFDEFSSVLNEFRALEDWSASYRRDYTPLMADPYLDQVAVRVE